jgi:hypothetical protein
MATLRRPWWTILEEERLQMHAFTWLSQQLRRKVRQALLRSLHYTSLYRRLILQSIETKAQSTKLGRAIQSKLASNHWEGTSLLKFVYGQLYNGKLVKRYGHAPTDACPLCHKPESCTHIARECRFHMALTISRHNAACQLIHAAIRKSAKGGVALHTAPDLVFITADAGSQPQTPHELLETLCSSIPDE